jgi:hypothetical protein
MFANDGDHGCVRFAGIVEIGETVREAGTKMEECQGWGAGDACIAVGCTGAHPFKDSEHRANGGIVVKRLDK